MTSVLEGGDFGEVQPVHTEAEALDQIENERWDAGVADATSADALTRIPFRLDRSYRLTEAASR